MHTLSERTLNNFTRSQYINTGHLSLVNETLIDLVIKIYWCQLKILLK